MAIIFPPGVDGETFVASNGIIYEFSDGAWRLAAGNVKAGVHVGTTPPNNPQAGDLWFHSGEADLKIYYIDSTSEQWIPASSPPDPYEENFVSIAGDTMTGRLVIVKEGLRFNKEDGTRQFTISPNNSDYFTNIYSMNCENNSGGMRFRVAPEDSTSGYKTFLTSTFIDHVVGSETHPVRTELNWLKTPTASHHAANKQYIDDAISALPIDTSRPKGMPGSAFQYSNSYDNSLPDGCFHITGNGDVQISRISLDGIEQSSYGNDSFSSSVKGICHVRAVDKRVLHSVAFGSIEQGKGTNQRTNIPKSTLVRDGKSDMVVGTTYWITDGWYNF